MLKPMGDRIVVKPLERQKSKLVEVIMRENPNVGEVVAAGPGKVDAKGKFTPNPCKPGDKIRFGTAEEYLSFPQYIEDGQNYLIMSWKDVCWVDETEQ